MSSQEHTPPIRPEGYGHWVGYLFIALGVWGIVNMLISPFFTGDVAFDFNALLSLWIGRRLTQFRNGFRIAAIVIAILSISMCLILTAIALIVSPQNTYIDLGPWHIENPTVTQIMLGTGFIVGISLSILLALLHPKTRKDFHWHIRQRLMAEGKCAQCEYDLTGNVSGICPECGSAVAKKIVQNLNADRLRIQQTDLDSFMKEKVET